MRKYVLTIRFIFFLLKTGNCRKFIYNYRSYRGSSRHILWFIFNELRYKPNTVILQAFYWGETPEEFEYWEKVHNEWRKVFHKLETN